VTSPLSRNDTLNPNTYNKVSESPAPCVRGEYSRAPYDRCGQVRNGRRVPFRKRTVERGSRARHSGSPRMPQQGAGEMALGGAFWGFLFGLICFAPFLGAAIGAGMAAVLWRSLEAGGIDEDFTASPVRRQPKSRYGSRTSWLGLVCAVPKFEAVHVFARSALRSPDPVPKPHVASTSVVLSVLPTPLTSRPSLPARERPADHGCTRGHR
jgi:hypothetical protein